MSKPHIYTVHINPSLREPYEKAVFIEEGFSWMAFFFTGLWALYNRLWWWALGIFIFNATMLQLVDSSALTHTGIFIVQLSAQILIGSYAHDWQRAKLRKRGYIIADIVTGDSLLGAEQRFFDRYFASHPSPAA
jgi:hypothetical protein